MRPNVALGIPLLDKPLEEDHLSVNNLVEQPGPHLVGKLYSKKKRKRKKICQLKNHLAARHSRSWSQSI